MRKVLFAAMLAAASCGALAAPAIADPAPAYSVETTDLGTLLDNPATKAVLMKHIPLVAGNEQINAARSMTLRQVQQFAADALPDATLAAIQADLAKLPKP